MELVFDELTRDDHSQTHKSLGLVWSGSPGSSLIFLVSNFNTFVSS